VYGIGKNAGAAALSQPVFSAFGYLHLAAVYAVVPVKRGKRRYIILKIQGYRFAFASRNIRAQRKFFHTKNAYILSAGSRAAASRYQYAVNPRGIYGNGLGSLSARLPEIRRAGVAGIESNTGLSTGNKSRPQFHFRFWSGINMYRIAGGALSVGKFQPIRARLGYHNGRNGIAC